MKNWSQIRFEPEKYDKVVVYRNQLIGCVNILSVSMFEMFRFESTLNTKLIENQLRFLYLSQH